MSTQKLTPISTHALDALRNAHYLSDVSRLLITRNKLPEKAYREVKEVCARLGGHWNQASQTFLFAYDPTAALAIVQASGVMPPKNPYAHFLTPDVVSEDMMRYAFHLFRCNSCEGYRHNKPLCSCQYIPADLRILEPSAGKGAIARWIRQLYASLGREDYVLHCCELDPMNRAIIRQQGFEVVADNFFNHHLKPGEAPYHIVLMNPPFLGLEYIDHIEYAWSLLDPREGRLVFIAPTSLLWSDDARCRNLRKLIRVYGEEPPFVYPRGHFKESGTPIETVLVSLMKQDQSWRGLPYVGFPSWHCYMLDCHISQTRELNDRQWQIWSEIDAGVLPESIADPEWHRTQYALREFFAHVIEHARTDWWVEIELDQASLHFMEAHFLEYGLLNCQCERHMQERPQHLAALRQQKQHVHAAESRREQVCEVAIIPQQQDVKALVQTSTTLSSPLIPGEYAQLALFPS